MTEEDERANNDGVNPSGDKEYREMSRYSVRSIPKEGVPDGEQNEEENNGGGGAGEGMQTKERLSREALEDKYRNDPRFSMLFEHQEKGGKKKNTHYIKVGGIRLTPKRILVLCGFLFVVLLCLGSSFFYAFKDLGKFKNYKRAVAVFEAGDYETARELFVKVINNDPNNEDAIKAMAQIYHHFGDWTNEAFFRQRLMRLNPLNEDYFHDFLNAAFRARNFGTIYSLLNLKVMENPELPPEEGALYLISALHTEHVSIGKAFHNDRIKSRPKYFSDTESGRYAEFLLNASEINREKIRGIIATLPDIKDSQIRFEKINTLLLFLSKQSDRESDEQMEKLLQESVELNEYAGAPMLAGYYFSHYRFEDSRKVCEDFLKTKMNAIIPIMYGESCLLGGRPDLIPPLADKVRHLKGRQSKIIASYLDALYAFSEGDETRLRVAMMEAGTSIETQVATLMRFQLALINDSPKEILFMLDDIMKDRPFLDFPQRARTAALEYLLKKADSSDLASDPERLNACAEIAELIQTPGDDVSFLKRIILLNQFKKDVLLEEDLLSAMKTYPGDHVLLRIAAEYCLKRGKAARAMDYITEYNLLEGIQNHDSIAILRVLALDMLGRTDEAEKEFRTLVERENEDVLLSFYFEFCVENRMIDSLKSLSSWIETLPNDSLKRAALPFIQAEILLADGKDDQALALFEKSPSDDPQFVFHAASRLADAGRTDAAIARYRSIQNTYPEKALVNLNLSELYFKKGDMKNALACARTAWEENVNDLTARYIYGKRLFESGQYADAVAVLKFPQFKASFPEEMLDLWANAIREQIKADYAAERYTPAIEGAKHLLIYFPDDETGQDIVECVQTIRRHEKTGGNE